MTPGKAEGQTTVAEQGEAKAPPKAPPKPRRSRSKPKLAAAPAPGTIAALTPAQRDYLRSHIFHLAGFFGYGEASISTPWQRWHELTPLPGNWFHSKVMAAAGQTFTIDGSTINAESTEPQLAAFAWFMLQAANVQANRRIVLPGPADLTGDGKKPGIIGLLFEARGPVDTARHIETVIANVDQIAASLGSYWPGLTDSMFRHKLVQRESDRLAAGQTSTTTSQQELA